MRIGLDIDNVISNFNEVLLSEYIKHDIELGNKGIPNPNANYITRGMFDWNEEEAKKFYCGNIERIAKSLKVIDGAKDYIDKLKQDGHYICIITGRDNGEYSNPYKMTKEWLDKHDIYYDELILTNAYDKKSKADVCIKKKINIMIDDSIGMCKNCIEKGIKAYIMDNEYNKIISENIPRVHNWQEIYEVISSEEKSNS